MNFRENFYRAKVLERQEAGGKTSLVLEIQTGDEAGKQIQLDATDQSYTETGSLIVIAKMADEEGVAYRYHEPYRLPSLEILMMVFVLVTLVIGGIRGFSSFLGLIVTMVILTGWVVPSIAGGGSPLMISFIGSVVMGTIGLFVAHGFKTRTVLAWVSTIATLGLSVVISEFAVKGSKLFGTGSDAAANLTMSQFSNLDLRGLLLGAIVIGVLGILDDVTTTQTATVEEIHLANEKLSGWELYKRGSSVGKEHIAALINTLVIAYAGATLPMFLLLSNSPDPLWVILNNEMFAEEIVRTIIGSMTLILAVPFSTGISAWWWGRKQTSYSSSFFFHST